MKQKIIIAFQHTTKSIGQSPSWSPSSPASNKAAETDPPLQTSSNEVTSPSTNLNSETSSLSSLTTSDSASSKTSESNKTRSNSPLKQNTINEKLNSSEANSNQVCEALHEYRGSPVEEETMLTFFSAMLHRCIYCPDNRGRFSDLFYLVLVRVHVEINSILSYAPRLLMPKSSNLHM